MSADGITTHDGARDYLRWLVSSWRPSEEWSIRTTATRVVGEVAQGLLALRGPRFEGHLEYALPVEPGLLRRRAFAMVVGDRRLPDYMREARAGA